MTSCACVRRLGICTAVCVSCCCSREASLGSHRSRCVAVPVVSWDLCDALWKQRNVTGMLLWPAKVSSSVSRASDLCCSEQSSCCAIADRERYGRHTAADDATVGSAPGSGSRQSSGRMGSASQSYVPQSTGFDTAKRASRQHGSSAASVGASVGRESVAGSARVRSGGSVRGPASKASVPISLPSAVYGDSDDETKGRGRGGPPGGPQLPPDVTPSRPVGVTTFPLSPSPAPATTVAVPPTSAAR